MHYVARLQERRNKLIIPLRNQTGEDTSIHQGVGQTEASKDG